MRAGAALVIGVLVVVAAWTGTRGGSPAMPLRQLAVRTDIEPRTHLFGDPVTARVHVELDRRLVDPDSVRLLTRFRPYSVIRTERRSARAGDVVVLRHRFTLLCVAGSCTPRGLPRQLTTAPVRIRYRLRSGATRSTTARWPPSHVTTRLVGVELPSDPQASLPWRLPAVPPAVSYRTAPGLVASALYGAVAVLALLAAVLVAPELRRLLGLAARRRDPLARLSPLERAVVLLERALASGSAVEQRKALDRLARELRVRGDDELAGAARRVAWSSAAPAEEARTLTGTVTRARRGRRP